MLSRFVIAFLPRSKCLLISQLQSPSSVTLDPKKRNYIFITLYLERVFLMYTYFKKLGYFPERR